MRGRAGGREGRRGRGQVVQSHIGHGKNLGFYLEGGGRLIELWAEGA